MENPNSWNEIKVTIYIALSGLADSRKQSEQVVEHLLNRNFLLSQEGLLEKIKAIIDEFNSDYIYSFGPSLTTRIYNALDDLKVIHENKPSIRKSSTDSFRESQK